MPDANAVERAADHFTREELDAIRTRRAVKMKWQSVDMLGADILARLPGGYALVQATKQDPSTEKRREMETLGGDEWVPVSERRIITWWESEQDPHDGRRTIHRFRVQELVSRAIADKTDWYEYDGRTPRAGPDEEYLWTWWAEDWRIDKEKHYEDPR